MPAEYPSEIHNSLFTMFTYVLTLLCAVTILLASFFAIRYRKVNAYVRMAALFLSAAFILWLYFRYDNTTQIYGLGILAIAFLFTLIDVNRHAEKQ